MRAIRPRRIVRYLAAILLGTFAITSLSVSSALASLSTAYSTTTEIPVGSLVALDEKSAGSVVIADTSNAERLFGVVVSPSAASISLGAATTSGQVQVATNGAASTLVSTAGGDIKVGDVIAMSPIAGVGQKASGQVRVIGTAQAAFSAASEGVAKRTLETSEGRKEVAIGQIPVLVQVATHNGEGSTATAIPSWAQSLSNSLAGKSVAPVRVIVAGLILFVSIISVAVLLYAAVRNSIISIGRNPLSRGAVFRGLLQVVAIALAILAVSIVAMYVVITV